MKKSGSVSSSEDLPIYYDLYTPEPTDSSQTLPLIIFLHGFKGFKDWGAFPEACQELSEAGFAVLAMNFSLNGVGESMTDFDQLSLFARQTLSQDLDDVGSVIDALKDGTIQGEGGQKIAREHLGILGHSRGGHTAVAAAAEYPEIACLVTWSAVANYNHRWSDEMIADWEQKGVTEIKNGRTGQIMPVKKLVFDDAQANADRLMADRRAKEIELPALFVHSKGDAGVPYQDAEQLYNCCASENKELLLMEDSGHTFDTSHPFDKEEFPDTFKQVVNKTKQWFQNNLQ